jgi:TatA/E family protein of Tat protein translocase
MSRLSALELGIVLNLGMSEIAVMLVVALLVLGPRQLPELASGLGRIIREIRKATAGLKQEIELDEAIRKPLEELREATMLPVEELRRRDMVKELLQGNSAPDTDSFGGDPLGDLGDAGDTGDTGDTGDNSSGCPDCDTHAHGDEAVGHQTQGTPDHAAEDSSPNQNEGQDHVAEPEDVASPTVAPLHTVARGSTGDAPPTSPDPLSTAEGSQPLTLQPPTLGGGRLPPPPSKKTG